MWIWMAPNHVRSIWKVIKAETFLRKLTRSKAIGFKVTSKESSSKAGAPVPPNPKDIHALWDTFCVTWYFVLYDLLFVASVIYIIYGGVSHLITPWILVIDFTSLFWVVLNCWCIWPPVSTLLPRVETAQGWQIQWKALFPGAVLETALSGFGITTMKIPRVQTLPPPSSGPPQPMLDFGRFSANGRGDGNFSAPKSDISDESTSNSSLIQNIKSYKSGKLAKYKSDTLVVAPQCDLRLSSSGLLGSRPTRASSGNFGRVAAPLQTAASMQASALLTGAILPEREGHTTLAARQPSLLAIAPSGELYPAPAGSMPYDVLTRASSLGRGRSVPRRDSLQGLSFDQQIQMGVDQVMQGSNAPAAAAAAASLVPAASMHRMPSALPFWMGPVIDEEASYHPSVRVSYSGPHGQAAMEEERAQAVVAAAAAKLLTVAEAKDEPAKGASEAENPFSGYGAFSSDSENATGANTSRRNSALLRLAGSIGVNELAALATLTGDFDALRGLAPVSNSPFVLSDILGHPISSPGSSVPASPCPPTNEASPSQAASPRKPRVSFQAVSPFDYTAPPLSAPFTAPTQLPADTNSYLDQSIRIEEEFADSMFLTDSLILKEQTVLEESLFSPFAAIAEEEWGPGKISSNASRELPTPLQPRISGFNGAYRLETAASSRARAASRQLLDIAMTLSPAASAALRTGSVFVVPVMPASIYDHSIVSKPSFEASPKAPKDYTYLAVSLILLMGLIACSLAEVPLRNVGY
jgi:hypothetical protein